MRRGEEKLRAQQSSSAEQEMPTMQVMSRQTRAERINTDCLFRAEGKKLDYIVDGERIFFPRLDKSFFTISGHVLPDTRAMASPSIDPICPGASFPRGDLVT